MNQVMKERREYTRYPVDFECIVIVDRHKEIPCKIEDISEKGARLTLCDLAIGDEVELSFFDDSETFVKVFAPTLVVGKGKVVRLSQRDVGVELYKSYELMEYINNRQASVYVERLKESGKGE